MPISENCRFAYIHIPKTGGTSLVQAMRSAAIDFTFEERGLWDLIYGRPDLADILQALRKCFPLSTLTEFPQQHLPAQVLQMLLGTNKWKEFFRFAFVRNPWDLVVSSYHFAKMNFLPVQYPLEPDIQAFVQRSDSFENFVNGFCAVRCDMSSFIEDKYGQNAVDFIGRFENYGNDLAYISRRIGVELRLPHENRSEHNNYATYYTKTTRDIVSKHFARDIDRFKYLF